MAQSPLELTEKQIANYKGQIEAIGKSQAVIEFNLDGTIITANENFLKTMGYSLNELVGRHHSLFVEVEHRNSREYQAFWQSLGRGQYLTGEIKRVNKTGQEIWLQASYNPIFDFDGKPFKVVKYATNITEQKLRNADYEGQLDAIGKSQAVIEFDLEGIILTANENFLKTMGYSLKELVGKHHSIFVEPDYKSSHEYSQFWKNLKEGKFSTGEIKRVDKGGNVVWLQASYNPIFDLNGNPYKVVKYASDITEDTNGRLNFTQEFQRLLAEIKQGNLQDRGNTAGLPALYSDMIRNINEVVEAIVAPMQEFQSRLSQVAQGDVKAFVTGDYQGEHAVLKDALNQTLVSLGSLADAATTISAGNLNIEVVPKSDVDAMGHAVAKILNNMNQTLGQVRAAADEIAIGSNQIADGSQSLAQGATQQASSLQQISASMAELSSQTDTNAQNSHQANQIAATAKQSAETGDVQMKTMIRAMSEINQSSQDISKIIKVIDSIAFKTNLLALNAAVEAARAGVHGKGFAVVSNEVRSLAGQSAQAAKETTEMIENSSTKVQQGIEIADQTAFALVEIVNGVDKVSDLIGEIAAASKEQADGIREVNIGLSQIERVTQSNTSVAEQSAASSQQLASQANNLKQLLSQFELRQETTASGLPAGVTPEMLEAIQRYLSQ